MMKTIQSILDGVLRDLGIDPDEIRPCKVCNTYQCDFKCEQDQLKEESDETQQG